MKRLLCAAALCTLLLPASGLAQQFSADAVASAWLGGLQNRDLALSAAHSATATRSVFDAILSGEVSANQIYESEAGPIITAWDGQFLAPRYGTFRDNPAAFVPFGYRGADDSFVSLTQPPEDAAELWVIILILEGADDDSWGVEEVESYTLEAYLGLADVPG